MSELFEINENFYKTAVERIKLAYQFTKMINPENKLHVAFSGGKDSVCVYGVCKLASKELGIDLLDMCYFQYNVTTVDPPELVKFIKTEFPFVKWHRTTTMVNLIINHGIPPTRMVRYCCAELKEVSTEKGQYTVTGVRKAESIKRANRESFEIRDNNRTKLGDYSLCENSEEQTMRYCMQKEMYVCNPIIDWSDEQVWSFIHKFNLPYCKLYDEGWKRLGCVGCPLGGVHAIKEFERWPGYKKMYLYAFDKMLEENKRKNRVRSIQWDNAQDVMDWWLKDEEYLKRHPMCLEKGLLFDELGEIK